MIGSKVQEEEPAWQLLMTLKDLVELVMSPTHTDESIGFLGILTSEHTDIDLPVFFHKRTSSQNTISWNIIQN